MKHYLLSIVLMGCLVGFKPTKSEAQVQVSFQLFYDDLSPYGNWFHHNTYGYVWKPELSGNFFPYGSNGYWVYTEAGWTWYSDYRWGWAPFHYGKWFYDEYYGWVWVPGYEWAPAWVVWRSCNGYYGWTPWEPGISINFAFSNNYHQQHQQWRFIRNRDLGRRDMEKRITGFGSYVNLLNKSSVIENRQADHHNSIYHAGPFRKEVEKITQKKLSPWVIKETNTPSQSIRKNNMVIFRPQFNEAQNNNVVAAPKKVLNWNQPKTEIVPVREEHHPVKQMPANEPENNKPKMENPQHQPTVITPKQPAGHEVQAPVKVEAPFPPKKEMQNNPPVITPKQPDVPVKQVPKEERQPMNIPSHVNPLKERPEKQQPVVPQPRKEAPVLQRPMAQPREVAPPARNVQQPQVKPVTPSRNFQQPEKRQEPVKNKPQKKEKRDS